MRSSGMRSAVSLVLLVASLTTWSVPALALRPAQKEQGSQEEVRLALVSSPAPAPKVGLEEIPPAVPAPKPALHPNEVRLLIVEDSEMTRRMLAITAVEALSPGEVLTPEQEKLENGEIALAGGMRVGVFADAKQAVQWARDNRPQLVLTDYELIHGTGREVTEAAWESDPSAAVVMMSGGGYDETWLQEQKQKNQKGVRTFHLVDKPYRPVVIQAQIGLHLLGRLKSSAGAEEPGTESYAGNALEFIRRYDAILEVADDPQERSRAIEALAAVSSEVPLTGWLRVNPATGQVYIDLPEPPDAVDGRRPTQVLYDQAGRELYVYARWGSGGQERTGLVPVFLSRRLDGLTAGSDLHRKLAGGRIVLLVPRSSAGAEEKPEEGISWDKVIERLRQRDPLWVDLHEADAGGKLRFQRSFSKGNQSVIEQFVHYLHVLSATRKDGFSAVFDVSFRTTVEKGVYAVITFRLPAGAEEGRPEDSGPILVPEEPSQMEVEARAAVRTAELTGDEVALRRAEVWQSHLMAVSPPPFQPAPDTPDDDDVEEYPGSSGLEEPGLQETAERVDRVRVEPAAGQRLGKVFAHVSDIPAERWTRLLGGEPIWLSDRQSQAMGELAREYGGEFAGEADLAFAARSVVEEDPEGWNRIFREFRLPAPVVSPELVAGLNRDDLAALAAFLKKQQREGGLLRIRQITIDESKGFRELVIRSAA